MSKYFGVIGNRDHIKIQGEKRPFWEFLDEQPDGWLCSIAYKRKDVPQGKPMIWDCGAWSYKAEETPRLAGLGEITPSTALKHYYEYAKAGDILIAPDHMLIPGVNLDARRRFNEISALAFEYLCRHTEFKVMATVHGDTVEERVTVARKFVAFGYRHLAIGGIAARASQPKVVFEVVEAIRKAVPGVWLHVLGLSAPKYAKWWHDMGIESFDGSSHFKQAFTAGKFYWFDGELKAFQASRRDNPITDAPECVCTACSRLRLGGIDTRTYGSNENNMGRAAHNMNMLMRAHKCVA